MVDADEETALLSAARDAAGQPPRRRGRVVAFVLVIGGVLAFVAAAGRGAAEDGAPFQVSGQPTSFFAKILSRSTPVLQMAMGPYQDNGFDFPAGQVENELDEQSHSG
mgnify:CR=1 FL=1